MKINLSKKKKNEKEKKKIDLSKMDSASVN